MKDSQLQKLSYPQLLDLQKRVAAAIAAKKSVEISALKKKINAMAEQAGFNVGDLFGGNGREKSATKVSGIKYRHPRNRSLVWSGRGRRPKWLAQESGNIERFRVS